MRLLKTAICVLVAAGIGVLPAQTPRVVVGTGSGSYLGVNLQELSSDRAKELKLPEVTGVEITRVEAGSPAEQAGLKSGDVVMNYNGERVAGMEQFSRLVRETPAGREVKVVVFRNGASQTLTAKVAARQAAQILTPELRLGGKIRPSLDLPFPDMPRSFMSWRSSVLGIEAESLDGQLAQYFGVKEGVLVRSVTKDSAAEKAGIKAGDVVTKIGDSKVTSPVDISSQLRSSAGKSVSIALTRDHKEMTVSVDPPFQRDMPDPIRRLTLPRVQ